jgi:hypothetical protein
MRYASPHSFREEAKFKLRNGTHNVNQQFGGGCRGVDSLEVGNEVNAQGSELLCKVSLISTARRTAFAKCANAKL